MKLVEVCATITQISKRKKRRKNDTTPSVLKVEMTPSALKLEMKSINMLN